MKNNKCKSTKFEKLQGQIHIRKPRHKKNQKHISEQLIYKCTVANCGQSFAIKKSRDSHVQRHNTNFVCKICGKAFNQSGCLNRHNRTHTGIKPFSCEICKKSFSQKSNLKVHSKIHNQRNEQ
jgi:uncharacterized Zn-finger protein